MISDRVKKSLKREFYQSRSAQVGLALVVIILLTAVFAPMLTPTTRQPSVSVRAIPRS